MFFLLQCGLPRDYIYQFFLFLSNFSISFLFMHFICCFLFCYSSLPLFFVSFTSSYIINFYSLLLFYNTSTFLFFPLAIFLQNLLFFSAILLYFGVSRFLYLFLFLFPYYFRTSITDRNDFEKIPFDKVILYLQNLKRLSPNAQKRCAMLCVVRRLVSIGKPIRFLVPT